MVGLLRTDRNQINKLLFSDELLVSLITKAQKLRDLFSGKNALPHRIKGVVTVGGFRAEAEKGSSEKRPIPTNNARSFSLCVNYCGFLYRFLLIPR